MAPVLANRSAHFLIVLVVFGSLAWINVRGVRSGARAVWIVTILKLVPLLIFVCAGIFFVRRADAMAITWPGAPALGRSVLILLFAFVGIEVALIPSGEVKDPARTVPRAIYLALAVTTAALPADPIGRTGNSGGRPREVYRDAVGTGGLTLFRRTRPQPHARRGQRFGFWFCRERYSQFTTHSFRLRA